MKKNIAFSLAEIVASMFVLGFLAALTIPSIQTSTLNKINYKGYKKAFKSLSTVTDDYLKVSSNYIESSQESAAKFIKYFVENVNVKELYATAYVTKNSDTYSSLAFKDDIYAGAADPASVSSEIEISSIPKFWMVTDDNLAYSVIIPKGAKCKEVLNINTAKNLTKTLKSSCFAVVIDTNGLLANPNKIEDTEDISQEKYIPDLKNDRYYIFVGSDGIAAGNPKYILSARAFNFSAE